MQLFLEQCASGVAMGSIYALITLGLALVYGILRILHVAHAGIYAVGAYLALGVFSLTDSLVLAALGAMGGCALLGVAMERFIYLPLLSFPPFVPLISSIAMLLGLEEICRLVAGPYILPFSVALPFADVTLGGVRFSGPLLSVYGVTAVVLGGLWFLTTRTELGLAMRATAQDRDMAAACGIPVRRVVAVTFALGSAVAAVAGMLVGIYYNQVYPTMGAVPAYKSLALIVVGGLGSVPGAVGASLLLGVAETLLIGYADIPLPRDALAFLAMVAVLMWRPQGLFGHRR